MLYPKIVAAWGLDANSDKHYNSYSRAYRNQTEDGYIPEVYKSGKEYKEVLLNDKIKALSITVPSFHLIFCEPYTTQFAGRQGG
jgi:hypothetical protein